MGMTVSIRLVADNPATLQEIVTELRAKFGDRLTMPPVPARPGRKGDYLVYGTLTTDRTRTIVVRETDIEIEE